MLRRWFSLRSMTWHLLMIVIVSGCSYAAWWQWGRAAQGNTLSYLYSIEWPVFAVVAIIGWWQLVTEKPEEFAARKEISRQASLPKPVAYDTEVLRQELARHPELVHAFPELATAFPELAPGAVELATSTHDQGASTHDQGAGAHDQGAGAHDQGTGGSAVAGGDRRADLERPVDVVGSEDVVDAPSSEVQAYNQVLARLAAQGKPKTWRNPRGRS